MVSMIQKYSMFLLLLLGACGFLESNAEQISQQQLLDRIAAAEDMLILDVRTDGEYAEGYISGAVHIDHREVGVRLAEISAFKNKPVIVYCYSGMRAAMVEATLIENGFTRVLHLQGDWSAWQEAGLPFVRPK